MYLCACVCVERGRAEETIDCRPGDERRAGRAVERLMPDNRLIGWNIHDRRFWGTGASYHFAAGNGFQR